VHFHFEDSAIIPFSSALNLPNRKLKSSLASNMEFMRAYSLFTKFGNNCNKFKSSSCCCSGDCSRRTVLYDPFAIFATALRILMAAWRNTAVRRWRKRSRIPVQRNSRRRRITILKVKAH